jgi:hypothetical protein
VSRPINFLNRDNQFTKSGLETVIGTEKVSLELLQRAGYGDQAFTTSKNAGKVFTFLDRSLGATRTTKPDLHCNIHPGDESARNPSSIQLMDGSGL